METDLQEVSTIDMLKSYVESVEATDTMAEAGRKILLADFVTMLDNEKGSRTGKDIESVHDMRVATRRMRTTFNLLGAYYKSKPMRHYVESLRILARKLGEVRDLDVMIANLQAYQEKLEDEEDRTNLAKVISKLDKQRSKARKQLISHLDSKEYAQFVETYTSFLTKPGKAAKAVDEDEPVPFQVRHVVPVIVHEYLANVRAYDNVLEDAEIEILHALRIEFKQLRYLIENFRDVLGNTAGDFIVEVKTMQDHLGRIQDIDVANEALESLISDLKKSQRPVLEKYITAISAEHPILVEAFPEVWARFNTRTVQQKLSNALLMLR
ncbi:MAG: CHAD domain-containing protein [Aggregatilineales bacterium]